MTYTKSKAEVKWDEFKLAKHATWDSRRASDLLEVRTLLPLTTMLTDLLWRTTFACRFLDPGASVEPKQNIRYLVKHDRLAVPHVEFRVSHGDRRESKARFIVIAAQENAASGTINEHSQDSKPKKW